jgi:hypothetical protein
MISEKWVSGKEKKSSWFFVQSGKRSAKTLKWVDVGRYLCVERDISR